MPVVAGDKRTLAVFLMAVVLFACTAAAPTNAGAPVPLNDARAFLARIVGAALSGNLGAVCQIADGGHGNCDDHLRNAPAGSAPHLPPTVVGFRTIPTRSDGDASALGGTVLVLCGIDGLNNGYLSEVLVFQSGHGLQAINGVYWLGIGIADGGQTTAVEPAPAGGC